MTLISPDIRNSRNFNKRFNKAYLAYIADFKGESNNSNKDELHNDFNTFLTAINDDDGHT